jgi:hypothetical protein
MNAEKLVALVTELCDNARDGLLSAGTAADAIAAAAASYQPGTGLDRYYSRDPERDPYRHERHRAAAAAGQQLAAGLLRQLGGNVRDSLLEPAAGTYHGMDLERIYQVADIIQQQVFETRPVGHWWTISAVARKGKLNPREVTVTLAWMAEHKFAVTNGRGGCWVNYGRWN